MTVDWLASAATIAAALMTAVNLGARVTGWGFALFALGSVVWIVADFSSGHLNTSLLVMHCVLLLVNLFGVWRWLGRQKRYEDSSEHAAKRSRRWAHVPTLVSTGSLIGATVKGNHGKTVGTVVDAMLICDDKRMAYVVISEGGIAGAGEILRAVSPEHLRFEKGDIVCDLSEEQWGRLPAIEDDHWPAEAPAPVR